jgi:hypothetical protein
VPGVEVGIGETTLIAESPRSIALRDFCARLLGWGGDHMPAVDHALRALRLAVACRSPLILRGEGDLRWVVECAATSLPEIEKATLRVVALKMSASLSDAARLLGMAPVSLARWLGRRSQPPTANAGLRRC